MQDPKPLVAVETSLLMEDGLIDRCSCGECERVSLQGRRVQEGLIRAQMQR